MKDIDLTIQEGEYHMSPVTVSIPEGTAKPVTALRRHLDQAMRDDQFLIISAIHMHPATWALVRTDPDIWYSIDYSGKQFKFDDKPVLCDKSLPL